jgi:hypothetical protein
VAFSFIEPREFVDAWLVLDLVPERGQHNARPTGEVAKRPLQLISAKK